jgi:hypothetical protein
MKHWRVGKNLIFFRGNEQLSLPIWATKKTLFGSYKVWRRNSVFSKGSILHASEPLSSMSFCISRHHHATTYTTALSYFQSILHQELGCFIRGALKQNKNSWLGRRRRGNSIVWFSQSLLGESQLDVHKGGRSFCLLWRKHNSLKHKLCQSSLNLLEESK